MPIIRRALTVAAVTAVGTLAFALPAWAHTATFERTCDHVTVNLVAKSFPAGTYTIDVFRDGTQFQEFTYDTSADSPTKTFPEVNDGQIAYHITWSNVDGRDNGHTNDETPPAPENCTVETPPTTTAPATSPAAKPPVQTHSATPSPTATPAVEAAKLANTGAGNTVPLLVVGTVLVAGGVGLTFVTRRRRSGSTSS